VRGAGRLGRMCRVRIKVRRMGRCWVVGEVTVEKKNDVWWPLEVV
jgi:hypothetical protein